MFAFRTYIIKSLMLVAITASSKGCFISRRVCATADIPELVKDIRTANRYEIVGHELLGVAQEGKSLNDTAKRMYPGVFADGGIPIMLKEEIKGEHGPNFILGPLHLILPIPDRQSQRMISKNAVEIAGVQTLQSTFTLQTKHDNSTSFWLPTAFLCFIGSGSDEGHPHFDVHRRTFCEVNAPVATHETINSAERDIKIGAIASKLKQMEDAGMITSDVIAKASVYTRQLDVKRREEAEQARQREIALKARQAEERKRKEYEAQRRRLALEQQRRQAAIGQTFQVQQPSPLALQAPYRIYYLERDSGSNFAYRFALELNGEPSIQTFFGIQKVFADEVRSAYHLEYPNADLHSLRVAVQPRLVNGRVEGQASVLTINPVSLSYDPNTRRGKLAVRFNAGQAEEARAWIRKNIETLARDKNIALTTGQLPPAATYYSLGEKIDGSVMEIEFKTE